jgi:hypothetical protein
MKESKIGVQKAHLDQINRMELTSDMSTSSPLIMNNIVAILACEDEHLAASLNTPIAQPTTPPSAPIAKTNDRESEEVEDNVRVTRSQSKKKATSDTLMQFNHSLTWHSGPCTIDRCSGNEDVNITTTPPSSGDPPGAEIVVIPSSDTDVENPNAPPIPNTAKTIVISSDASASSHNPSPTRRSTRCESESESESPYDPAESLPLTERSRHYFDLGRKMEKHSELRLKRIIDNTKTSHEDYREAVYQLHCRFPRHKRGRAVEAWRR